MDRDDHLSSVARLIESAEMARDALSFAVGESKRLRSDLVGIILEQQRIIRDIRWAIHEARGFRKLKPPVCVVRRSPDFALRIYSEAG